jgi:hypothetical protein
MKYVLIMHNKNKIPSTNSLPNKAYKPFDSLEIETKKCRIVLKK